MYIRIKILKSKSIYSFSAQGSFRYAGINITFHFVIRKETFSVFIFILFKAA